MFRGWAPGEVLFLGAVVRKQDNQEDPWSITYRFAVERNRFNFAVGSIVVAEKLGWDYMWVRYSAVDDGITNAILRVPVAAYVEQVYDAANFALLGIGT